MAWCEKVKFIVIDFQCFRWNKCSLIPKELATCNNDNKKSHFIFKPPFSFSAITEEDRSVARYISSYHHGIRWHDGFTSCSVFDEIIKRLCVNVDVIYVKGRQKKDYLKNIIDKPIVDLVYAENIQRGEPTCAFHTSNYVVCAASNCQRLYEYLVNPVNTKLSTTVVD